MSSPADLAPPAARKRDAAAAGEKEPFQGGRALKATRSDASAHSALPPVSPPPPDDFDLLLPQGQPPPSPCTALFKQPVNSATKYIVVSGGVCSSLGKGVATSSIGALLRSHGFRVTAIKLDPYVNIDAGLMSPFEHGEVFVLDDGGETDLDLGNYERMMYLSLQRNNNLTTGKVYQSVISKERRGDYLGKTVQVVPHITGEIIDWLDKVGQTPVDGSNQRPHVCMVELGGTVGDIESMPFIEALRQFKFRLAENSMAWCHISYVPNMSGQKTKPTQHSVKALLSLGVQPDLILCRSPEVLDEGVRKKISNQCNIQPGRIFSAHDVNNLFHFPQMLSDQHIVGLLNGILRLGDVEILPSKASRGLRSLDDWKRFAKAVDTANAAEEVVVAFVGKYNKGGGDAYQSVLASLHHSAVSVQRKLRIEWVNSTDLEIPASVSHLPEAERQAREAGRREAESKLREAHGIFVPGGFGDRGIEGKIRAAGLARQWKKPYFGVCLGMQVALIDFARDVLGIADATSAEFDLASASKNHVLLYMPEISKETMGANMRLGSRWVEFPNAADSICSSLYGGANKIMERHRHRYEFNVAYKQRFEAKGMRFTGQDESKERMDIIELAPADHPFYLAVQFHPEYKSRPGQPSPPFLGFIAACCGAKKVQEVVADCRQKGPTLHWTPAVVL